MDIKQVFLLSPWAVAWAGRQVGADSHGKSHAAVAGPVHGVGQGLAGVSGQPVDGTGVQFAAVAHSESAHDVG